MAFKMKGFGGFGNSPVKQKTDPKKPKNKLVAFDSSKFPEGYTKEDVKFLKEQREDVVRREDLDEKGKAIWDAQRAKKKGTGVYDFDETKAKDKKDSPTKQKVQLGEVPYMNVDISTKEGRDILKRHKNIPTISSSDPSRITKPKFSLKNTAKKIIKTGGRVLGGLGVAATLHEFHKSGQKHSGGKVYKNQKSFMEDAKKKTKSIFKK